MIRSAACLDAHHFAHDWLDEHWCTQFHSMPVTSNSVAIAGNLQASEPPTAMR
jgi:hypothetical protein